MNSGKGREVMKGTRREEPVVVENYGGDDKGGRGEVRVVGGEREVE